MPDEDINFKKASSVLDGLTKVFTQVSTPAPQIPPPQAIAGSTRVGLSPKKIAASIIDRQSEAGAPQGPLPDGSDNVSEKMERIRVEEIVKAIVEDMRITIGIQPGTPVTATGMAGPIPVVVQGATVGPGIGYGIPQ